MISSTKHFPPSGFIKCDKPAGWSSFDVVAKVRAVLNDASRKQGVGSRVKVGHSGTLDPFATGLMVLAVGQSTTQLKDLLKAKKTYQGTMCLGTTSETGDPEGPLQVHRVPRRPSEAQVGEVMATFLGSHQQIPPRYSAIKLHGRRAYHLARAGQAVILQPRPVVIYHLELLAYRYPSAEFRCCVSSGTYIRVLAEEIGQALAVGAYLKTLRRLRIADIGLSGALDPKKVTAKDLAEAIQPSLEML